MALRRGNKSQLMYLLTQNTLCPELIEIDFPASCLVIDGQAWVVAFGKSASAVNFGDYADTFVNSIWRVGARFQRIDVVFDRYIPNSIKGNTRKR